MPEQSITADSSKHSLLHPPKETTALQDGLLPREGRILSVMLSSMGVTEIDPKVIPQLLEFAHRYASDVFQDAHIYSGHASKTEIDVDDVRLAIQGRVNHSFTSPPSKELIMDLAKEKNQIPLPLIPEKYGIRLPHERHCLSSVNFTTIAEATSKAAVLQTDSSTTVQSLPKMLRTGAALAAADDTNITKQLSTIAPPGTDASADANMPDAFAQEPSASSGGAAEQEGNADDDDDDEVDDDDDDDDEMDPETAKEGPDPKGPDIETAVEENRKRRLAEDDDYDF